MVTEPRRRWGALRGVLGAVLGLGVEALAVGVFILAALAVAAFVLWVA
jgi:hypothetical protein